MRRVAPFCAELRPFARIAELRPIAPSCAELRPFAPSCAELRRVVGTGIPVHTTGTVAGSRQKNRNDGTAVDGTAFGTTLRYFST
jgi:hypothetical protein